MAQSSTAENLGQLFGNSKLPVRLEKAAQIAQDLNQKVGTTAYELPNLDLSKKGVEIDAFGLPLKLDAELALEGRIRKQGYEAENIFPGADPITAPNGHSFADFALTAGLDVAGNLTDLPVGGMLLDIDASANAGLAYRHLLPVKSSSLRRDAFESLIETTRLPRQLDPSDLAIGEIHHLDGQAALGLALKLTAGADFDFEDDFEILDDLPIEIKAKLEAAFEATFGFAYSGEVDVTIARLAQDVCRLRITRKRANELTLGARIQLDIDYDLGGSSLIKILDDVLAQDSVKQVFDAMAKVEKIAGEVADGDWDAIKKRIGARAAEAFEDFWDDQDLSKSGVITEVTGALSDVVKLYENVDPKVRSWWSDLLASAGLDQSSKLRQALKKLETLSVDNFNLSELASGEVGEVVELLETLAGEDLEDMIVSSSEEIRDALERVRKLAGEAGAFLDKIAGFDQQMLDRFKKFAEKTGLAATITELKKYDTPAEIKAQGSQRARALAERLAGKLIDKIGKNELKEIQASARKLENFLNRALAIDDKIRKGLEKLKGKASFSLALQFQRSMERTAMLDLTFDPTVKKTRKAVMKGLDSRSIPALLLALPEPEGDNNKGVLALSSVITTRRVLSGTFSLELFGFSKSKFERIIESRVEIDGSSRKATFSGGFVRSVEKNGANRSGGLWLGAATNSSKRVGPFEGPVDYGLRLTFSSTDSKTQPVELQALDQLLFQFGFVGAGEMPVSDQVPAMAETRFTFDVRLGSDAADTFFSTPNKADWNPDYSEAAQRWLRDGLVADPSVESAEVSKGMVLAEVVETPEYQKLWAEAEVRGLIARQKFEEWAKGFIEITLDKSGRTIRVMPWRNGGTTLLGLLMRRGSGFGAFAKKIGPTYSQVRNQPTSTGEDLRRLCRVAATSSRKAAAPVRFNGWPNPMFIHWLALTRLSRRPSSLEGAQGLASLRFRQSDDEQWSAPVFWQLAGDVRPFPNK